MSDGALLSAYLPTRRQRALLVGQTGSGKTTLATHMLKSYSYVVALDPKITLGSTEEEPDSWLEGYELCRTPEELAAAAATCPLLQYRPDPAYQDWESWDRVYWWLFEARNRVVYTDEVNLVCRGPRPTDGMRACVTSGRERGIGMLHATQRPAAIPQILYSESEHIYVFRLEKRDDRRRLSEGGMPELVLEEPAERYWFWHKNAEGNTTYLRLNLGS